MALNWLAKTTFAALLGIIPLWTAAPVLAAGTLPLAWAQQIDINGQPLANCQVSFFVAGTPAQQQDSFSDFGLTQKNPWPLTCDQTGRVPMFWLADGLVHVRLTDSSGAGGPNGTPIVDTTMQVLGPSSGGGGGGSTIDPTTILATGDLKVKYGIGSLTGFVRLNGLTIGNATSGASERANSDTQNLFVYLYNADPNLVVSGGRTGNALNDYNANKQLTVPDWRGYALAALDDMGNSAAGRLTAAGFGPNATTLGTGGGAEKQTLSLAQLPTGISSNGNNTIQVSAPNSENFIAGTAAINNSYASGPNTATNILNPYAAASVAQGVNTIVVTSSNTGGQPHPTVGPEKLATFYIKL